MPPLLWEEGWEREVEPKSSISAVQLPWISVPV